MYSIKSENLKKEKEDFLDSSKPPKLKKEEINNLNSHQEQRRLK